MARSKKIYVLLIVLVVLCVAAFAATRIQQHQEDIKNADEIIFSLAKESVTGLSWEYDGTSLSFTRQEDGWIYDDDADFPVNTETVEGFLERFEDFGVAFIIESPTDLAPYGLDDPLCTITISTESQSYDILLGDYSQLDEQRYISTGDGNVYLVSDDPLDDYDAVLDDMMLHDDMPKVEQADKLTITGVEDYAITYNEENAALTYCEDDVYFTTKYGKTMPLDSSRVYAYLRDLGNLTLTDYVTYAATGEDMATYGLDDPELMVTVDYTDEGGAAQSFMLSVSRDPAERGEAYESGDTIKAYARVDDSPIIYRLTTDEYTYLMAATVGDLRHHEVLSADFTHVKSVDVTLEGESYTFARSEDDDSKWLMGEEDIIIADFMEAVQAMTVTDFTSLMSSGKEEVRMTFHLDNENFPAVNVVCTRYDGEHCLVSIDGTYGFVTRSQVVDLVEAVNGFVLG